MAGHGLKWDSLITVLWIWGVWDMKIGGLEDFQLGRAQLCLLVWFFFYSVTDFFSVPKVNSEDRKEAITKVIGGSKV